MTSRGESECFHDATQPDRLSLVRHGVRTRDAHLSLSSSVIGWIKGLVLMSSVSWAIEKNDSEPFWLDSCTAVA
jgi:hypothetical protein